MRLLIEGGIVPLSEFKDKSLLKKSYNLFFLLQTIPSHRNNKLEGFPIDEGSDPVSIFDDNFLRKWGN